MRRKVAALPPIRDDLTTQRRSVRTGSDEKIYVLCADIARACELRPVQATQADHRSLMSLLVAARKQRSNTGCSKFQWKAPALPTLRINPQVSHGGRYPVVSGCGTMEVVPDHRVPGKYGCRHPLSRTSVYSTRSSVRRVEGMDTQVPRPVARSQEHQRTGLTDPK